MRDDMAFNVKFCELIENYAVLYDYTRSDYCNRSVQDQAWEMIANTLNETVQNCKDRWKNIRNRYAKYNKSKLLPSGSAAKPVKEYYLAPHLNFLDKYLKSRTAKSNLQHTQDESDDEDDDSMSSYRPPSHSPSPRTEYNPSPLSTSSSKKSGKPSLGDVNQSAFDYFTKKRRHCEKQPEVLDTDLSFLQSMLSDMKVMNLAQKRRFKIGVMNLASQILDENDFDPISNNMPNTSSLVRDQNIASSSISQQDQTAQTFYTLSPYSAVSSVQSTQIANTEEPPLSNNTYFSPQ